MAGDVIIYIQNVHFIKFDKVLIIINNILFWKKWMRKKTP